DDAEVLDRDVRCDPTRSLAVRVTDDDHGTLRAVLQPEDGRDTLSADDDAVARDRHETPEPELTRPETDDPRAGHSTGPVERLLKVVSRGERDRTPTTFRGTGRTERGKAREREHDLSRASGRHVRDDSAL